MDTYTATIRWERGDQPFLDKRYSRAHTMTFDGGAIVRGSSSPHVVPVPYADPAAVDPEEALVAAASSCHMLWFLAIAAARGYRVDRYEDAAEGTMDRDAEGRLAITRIALRPRIAWSGDKIPDEGAVEAMHHKAHASCYIANSIRSEIVIEPPR